MPSIDPLRKPTRLSLNSLLRETDPSLSLTSLLPLDLTWPSTSPISRAQWVKTKTSLGQTVDVIKGAVTGDTAAPGALRVINASDLELARQTEAQSV